MFTTEKKRPSVYEAIISTEHDFLLRTSDSIEDVLITHRRSHVLVMAKGVYERGYDFNL